MITCDELDMIVSKLKILRRPIVGLLQDGLSLPELRIRTGSLAIKLSKEVNCLYGWRNGTYYSKGDKLDDLHFFPGFYFMPIEKAIVHYRRLCKAPGWNNKWFPLFANGGGDFYATICSDHELDISPLVGYLMGESKQDIEYESLFSMIRTIRAAFERGAFYLTAKGYMEIDYTAHAKIAKEFNPSVALWKDA